MLFFEFPENASWNDKRDCVEFSVILGPYEGTVRVPRRVFQGLLDQRPTPERCIEAFHPQRTRFEMIAERKLRRRQLTDDAATAAYSREHGGLSYTSNCAGLWPRSRKIKWSAR